MSSGEDTKMDNISDSRKQPEYIENAGTPLDSRGTASGLVGDVTALSDL